MAKEDNGAEKVKIGIAGGDVDLLDQLIEDKGADTKVADIAEEVIKSTPKDTRALPEKK